MSPAVLLAAAAAPEHRNLTLALFVVFVGITLYITFWASRHTKTATDFYAGGRTFKASQNGMAIAGDYMSAASFLGIAGLIAIFGYDGFLYSIGFLVAWLVALLLVAELLRNSGRFTMADVLAFRMKQRPVRMAAGISTITVSIFYLIAQMVGAGALVALLTGVTGDAAKNLTIVIVGALMIFYVSVGGMKGTTWVQIVKAVMLMTGAILITLLVLIQFGGNFSDLLGQVPSSSNPVSATPNRLRG
jgi:cation/acetate symporter